MITLVDRIPELRDELEEVANPDKVAGMEAYLKGRFSCLGVSSPDRNDVAKPLLKAVRTASEDELLTFVQACWDEPEREFHYIGADALRRGAKKLSANSFDDVRTFIETNSWWDTVDNLASNTVGPMLTNHPELLTHMDDWIDDPNMWIARTAIIYQLKYKDAADGERIFEYALRRASDTEFFIRKAIGWALRQHSRVDPDGVRTFVEANAEVLSGLTKREALRLLK